ncbi:MAG: enoyl-CoA hydratase/isomerase family protein [Chloroflexota bacterium]
MTNHINYSVDAGVAQIQINRPEQRNALALTMIKQIAEAVEQASSTPDVRVIVLTGVGKVFSAGADLNEIPQAMVSPEAAKTFDTAFNIASQAIKACPLPTIAKLQGHTVGGGLLLASSCDIRVTTANAKFAYPVTRIGLILNREALKDLINLIGLSRSKLFLFSGQRLTAQQAEMWGLVDWVFDDDVFDAEADRLILDIAAGAPLSIQANKRMINEIWQQGHVDETLADESYDLIYNSTDLREGFQAAREKRTTNFQGQ